MERVENNGKHVKHGRKICFMTTKGNRTPKYIWVGKNKFGMEQTGMTKKELISSIELTNEVFTEHPELLERELLKQHQKCVHNCF